MYCIIHNYIMNVTFSMISIKCMISYVIMTHTQLTDGNTCCDKKVQNKNYNNGTLLVKFIGVNHPPYFKECPQKGTISIPEKSPNSKFSSISI